MELPSLESLRFIVARYAYLRSAYGEVVDAPELVEPTGDFFPDAFEKTPEGVAKLVRRTLTYAPLDESLEFGLEFMDAASESGGCGTGACAPGEGTKVVARAGARDVDGVAVIALDASHVSNPVMLTTSIARCVGELVLLVADDPSPEADRAVLGELAAVQTGLGLLLLNGASVYMKACSGLREHRATTLSIEELAVALALFHAVHGVRTSQSKKHLATTQREAFGLAEDWVASNPELVAALRDAPERLADGVFEMRETRGFFSRLFAGRSDPAIPTAEDFAKASSKAKAKKARDPRLDEHRAMVEEALKKA